jgi:hypothetical protein
LKKLAFAALGALALALASGASTAAAEPAASGGGVNCVMSVTNCGYNASDLEAATLERVVTLWTEPQFGGTGLVIWGPVRDSGRVCTATTTDVDKRVDLDGTFMYRNAESVQDFAGAHCDWQLIGPNGGHSTWVENDIPDLQNLGSGWRNQAASIRFT